MMDIKYDTIVLGVCVTAQGVSAYMQGNEMFQRIQIIIGIISGAVALCYYGLKFVISLAKWLKKATKDGKIDENELDELDKIVDTIKPKEDNNND